MAHGYMRETRKLPAESHGSESEVKQNKINSKHRKLSKFKASRHPHRVLKEKTDDDEREKAAQKRGEKSSKKEGKRERIYEKSE